jgi:hypothetical protein
VILTRSAEENARRIENEERVAKGKPQDPELVGANKAARPLLDHGGDALLRLDVTTLPAQTAAESIAQWVNGITLSGKGHGPALRLRRQRVRSTPDN